MDIHNLEQPYLIGEIGINHNGDINIAKKLIDAVNACSWDCAKFQKRNPDICVPEHQKNKIRETPWGNIRYIDYKYKIEFGKSINWAASVWDIDSLEFIMNYDTPFIKIPSAMMTNSSLLKECARTQKTIIMSTGMSEMSEVDEAVDLVLKYNDRLVLMHTNSSYPTPVDEINLRLIPFLKERYGCVVGYSGHEEDLEPTVVAVALGAQVVERHKRC